MRVASRYQMMSIDESLLKHYTIEQLVDKASDCLVEEVSKFNHVTIVCGNGNNGADGYSLALKVNAKVFPCKLDKMSQACKYYYEQCLDKNLVIDYETFINEMNNSDCIVDAIFGFGCHSNPRGIFRLFHQR